MFDYAANNSGYLHKCSDIAANLCKRTVQRDLGGLENFPIDGYLYGDVTLGFFSKSIWPKGLI